MATTYSNVPNVEVTKLDGNLAIQDAEVGKRVLILGTASKGPGLEPYRVRNAAVVRSLFGTSGSLIRGYYQALASGYDNIWLFRIGAKGAVIEGIGDSDPYTVITNEEDADVNGYYLYYDPYNGYLKVWDSDPSTGSSATLLYDNENGIDLGYVSVSGNGSGSIGIGSYSGGTYTAKSFTELYNDWYGGGNTYDLSFVELGTDGVVTNPTKIQLFEYYYNALDLLVGQRFERIVLMDVYADDWSIGFINPGDTVDGITISSLAEVLPTNLRDKVLGWVHIYKNDNGENQFDWAWDLVYNASSGKNWNTTTNLRLEDKPTGYTGDVQGYHEVDFGYLLANFCYNQSVNDYECSGVIGVNPPDSYTIRSIHKFIGKLPTYDPLTPSSDAPYRKVTANGSGLCGFPLTVGCLMSSRNILVRDGTTTTFYPGYYATDTGFMDGSTIQDEGGFTVDIGKYLDIFAGWPRYYQTWDRASVGYSGSGAAWYAGFQLLRPSYEAPTNKLITTSIKYPYNVSKQQLDDLVTARMVHFQRKDRGVVVCSACTAAMLNSDFVRRSGTAIVQDIVTALRNAADPFLGNGFGIREKTALDTAISSVLDSHKPNYITYYNFAVTPGVIRGTLGSLRIDLHLVVVNEIGKIYVVVGMQRSENTQ